MKIRHFTFKSPSMALAIALCLPLSSALATTPVDFNPDGQGGDAVTLGSLDWAPGSALIADEIPLAPDTTVTAQAFAHAALAGAADADGNPVGLDGLNVGYEITLIVSNGVEINTNSDGTVVLLALDPDGDNFFEMYYDDTPDANALTGTGYGDGQLILSGQVTALSGNFTATDLAGPFGTLDQFGTDNWSGAETIAGEGSQNIDVVVQSVDMDFFTSGVDLGTVLPFNNSQVLPFRQTNPSMSFDALGGGTLAAAPGDINGVSGPDILLQMDANNAFEFVPPPPDGDQGCTPGYWKTHLDAWPPTGYSPNQALNTVFTFPANGPVGSLGSSTLHQALNFDGGPGLMGMAQILLRAAVAAVLNAAHPDVAYPLDEQDLIADVGFELQNGSRDSMEELKDLLDAANNGILFDDDGTEKCPLN